MIEIDRDSAGRSTKRPAGSPVTVAVTATLLPSSSSATPQSSPAGTLASVAVPGPGSPAGMSMRAMPPFSHASTTATAPWNAAPGPVMLFSTVTSVGFAV